MPGRGKFPLPSGFLGWNMKNQLNLLLVCIGAVTSLLLLAIASCGRPGDNLVAIKPSGAWVSSGGELFKDANNPWFLKNTPTVKYCVQVDTSSFSASKEKVEGLIVKALAQWQKDFVLWKVSPTSGGIGTQNFIKSECSADTPLVFKLGYGTLSADDLEYLSSAQQYVSIAVRTDYDEEQLRGRGFIYIGSDRGPARFEGRADLVDAPWQYDGLLYRVLVHEIGHVFGVAHTGEGLMSAQFPEQILMRRYYEKFAKVEDLGSFFFPQHEYHNCNITPESAEWLEMPKGWKCLHIERTEGKPGKEGEIVQSINFSASESETSKRVPIAGGMFKFDVKQAMKGGLFGLEISRGIHVYLTPRQKVYQPKEVELMEVLGLPFYKLSVALNYKTISGKEKPIYLKMTSNSYELLGVRDGLVESLVYYRQRCQNLALWAICLEP